jgi:hypothetical protein
MLFDLVALAGLVLLGLAVYLVAGMVAALAFAGLALVVVGVGGAWLKAREKMLE